MLRGLPGVVRILRLPTAWVSNHAASGRLLVLDDSLDFGDAEHKHCFDERFVPIAFSQSLGDAVSRLALSNTSCGY